MNEDLKTKMLGESTNYAIWVSLEPDSGDEIYHIEIQNVTIHLFADEWEEFVDVMMNAIR